MFEVKTRGDHTPPALPEEALSPLEFLAARHAGDVGHSGSRLLEHLKGVAEILGQWGEGAEIVHAGLFHSVYGTEAFRRAIVKPEDRTAVQEVIGKPAERLAHIYGGMNANSFLAAARGSQPYQIQTRWVDDPITLSQDDMRALGLIFAANWLEQFPRMRGKTRVARMDDFKHLAVWLGGQAQTALNEVFGFDAPPLLVPRIDALTPAATAPVIHTWDDAVPLELQLRLAGVIDLNIWRYGWKAASEQTAYGFWHSHFGGDDDSTQPDCEHELVGRQIIAPVLELWRMLKAGPLKGQVLVRAYANGHTFGGDGHLHIDHEAAGQFTTIFYAHPEWKANWAGETVFFNESEDEIIKAIYPKPGRIAHFPGNIKHAARSPGRECPSLRAVFVFKSRVKRPDEEG